LIGNATQLGIGCLATQLDNGMHASLPLIGNATQLGNGHLATQLGAGMFAPLFLLGNATQLGNGPFATQLGIGMLASASFALLWHLVETIAKIAPQDRKIMQHLYFRRF
jgi:hypothetical protein